MNLLVSIVRAESQRTRCGEGAKVEKMARVLISATSSRLYRYPMRHLITQVCAHLESISPGDLTTWSHG